VFCDKKIVVFFEKEPIGIFLSISLYFLASPEEKKTMLKLHQIIRFFARRVFFLSIADQSTNI
jgi:hypothetical protein